MDCFNAALLIVKTPYFEKITSIKSFCIFLKSIQHSGQTIVSTEQAGEAVSQKQFYGRRSPLPFRHVAVPYRYRSDDLEPFWNCFWKKKIIVFVEGFHRWKEIGGDF